MKAQAPMTAQQAKAKLEAQGVSISGWARREGFSVNTVHSILRGNRKCRFGVSHQIAVKLGMKSVVTSDGT